jgi:hypothetical protein
MEKVTLLEAKKGVRLNYVPCKEEAVEERLMKEEEGRRIALIQTPSVRAKKPPRDQCSKTNGEDHSAEGKERSTTELCTMQGEGG